MLPHLVKPGNARQFQVCPLGPQPQWVRGMPRPEWVPSGPAPWAVLVRRGVVAIGVAVGVLAPNVSRAEGLALDGSWTMGAISESFVVQQWGAACGPPPVSGT